MQCRTLAILSLVCSLLMGCTVRIKSDLEKPETLAKVLNNRGVDYADDFVICCKPGNAEAARTRMKLLMARLGLEVNETKTRIARLPEESFNFLGYTFGRFYGKRGRPYIGTRPSRKSVKNLLARIHERTTSQWYADEPQNTIAVLSRVLRGWCGYFDQGPVMPIYDLIRRYTERRVRRWLMRRTKRSGTGFGQIPPEHLYETLGLYAIPLRRGPAKSEGLRNGRKPDAGNPHVRFDEREQETELCQPD